MKHIFFLVLVAAFALFGTSVSSADERMVLQYDAPAIDKAVANRGKIKPKKFGFMQTALRSLPFRKKKRGARSVMI